jgi:ammonium transporter, Amt family
VQLSVGAVRATNAKNIMLLILLDACFGCLAFYLIGFALAYGGTFGDETKANEFIGWGAFALKDLPKEDWYMWFFQYAVCARYHDTHPEKLRVQVAVAVP